MYNILQPEGEVLLVFLASNPIFTMYQRMAERTEWAEYMKDVDEFIPNYQNSSRPAEMFEAVCHSVGFEVIECTAPERSFTFQNVNTIKSKAIISNASFM